MCETQASQVVNIHPIYSSNLSLSGVFHGQWCDFTHLLYSYYSWDTAHNS